MPNGQVMHFLRPRLSLATLGATVHCHGVCGAREKMAILYMDGGRSSESDSLSSLLSSASSFMYKMTHNTILFSSSYLNLFLYFVFISFFAFVIF